MAQQRPASTAVKNEASLASPNSVLLLLVAQDPAGRHREARFYQELSLSLDQFTVQKIQPAEAGFRNLALGTQIDLVRPIIDRHQAVAAIWLIEHSEEVLLLHLVAVSTGRALVRLVETDLNRIRERELAASARELLGTAYLFETPTQKTDSPMDQVVTSVRRQTSANATRGKWAVLLKGNAEGGISGQTGPSVWFGGTLGLERRLIKGFHGRIGMGIFGGPVGEDPVITVEGFALAPNLGVLYLWPLGPFSMGPLLELRAWWSNLSLQTGQGPTQRFNEWLLKAALHLELHWPATDELELFLSAGLSGTPVTDTFNRTSDQTLVYATPYLSWKTCLGVLIRL